MWKCEQQNVKRQKGSPLLEVYHQDLHKLHLGPFLDHIEVDTIESLLTSWDSSVNKIMDVLCIYVDLDLSDQHDVDLDVGNGSWSKSGAEDGQSLWWEGVLFKANRCDRPSVVQHPQPETFTTAMFTHIILLSNWMNWLDFERNQRFFSKNWFWG